MKVIFLYIDPGSGSYLIQAIIAAVVGGLFYIKSGWLRIKSFFIKNKKEDPSMNDHKDA
ncbi:MAG TPA: hypothetical protein VNS58_21060 [Puia sp.]|jgi:hypothetical protein|nr:hypothetical protein [Puia sp.]